MTMQIAIEAKGGLILASDQKINVRQDHMGIRAVTDGKSYESKIRISKRHNIAVALQGHSGLDANPTQEFVDHISQLESLPIDLFSIIREWGTAYQSRQEFMWPFSFLIVNPNSEHEQLWKVQVRDNTMGAPYSGYIVNGNETSPAILWPEYCKGGDSPDLDAAINIAALTILTGRDLSPDRVGRLEIWKYKGAWERLDAASISAIVDRFEVLKLDINRFIRPFGSA